MFYRACDEMGLAVIQDMPSMSADGRVPNTDEQAEFRRQLGVLIEEHRNYPSIVTWVCCLLFLENGCTVSFFLNSLYSVFFFLRILCSR